jgi:hypothetical protein
MKQTMLSVEQIQEKVRRLQKGQGLDMQKFDDVLVQVVMLGMMDLQTCKRL